MSKSNNAQRFRRVGAAKVARRVAAQTAAETAHEPRKPRGGRCEKCERHFVRLTRHNIRNHGFLLPAARPQEAK
jgi:hypothetical protein